MPPNNPPPEKCPNLVKEPRTCPKCGEPYDPEGCRYFEFSCGTQVDENGNILVQSNYCKDRQLAALTKELAALCDTIESQAAEIERLRKCGRNLLAAVDAFVEHGWKPNASAKRDWDEARAALEVKP